MRKIIVCAATIAVLAGVSGFAGKVRAQGEKSNKSAPHKVGLIDMAHIFKEYKKFGVLRDDLKLEITKSDSEAKSMAQQLQQLQAELKTFTNGSKEYIETERKMAKGSSDFEAFRKLAQRDFLRKESKIYKTVYLEVTDMVEKYAKHYKYTLIIRFNREGLSPEADPNNVIKSMNRQVVFSRPQDDITEQILKVLNDRYSSSGSGSGRSSVPRESRRTKPGTRKN